MFSCMTQLMLLPLSFSLTPNVKDIAPPPPTLALPDFVCLIDFVVTNPLHWYLITYMTFDLPEYQLLLVFSEVLMVEHSYKSRFFLAYVISVAKPSPIK